MAGRLVYSRGYPSSRLIDLACIIPSVSTPNGFDWLLLAPPGEHLVYPLFMQPWIFMDLLCIFSVQRKCVMRICKLSGDLFYRKLKMNEIQKGDLWNNFFYNIIRFGYSTFSRRQEKSFQFKLVSHGLKIATLSLRGQRKMQRYAYAFAMKNYAFAGT